MKKAQTALSLATGVVLVAGAPVAYAIAPQQADVELQGNEAQQTAENASRTMRLATVAGKFSFTQNAVDENATIARNLYDASKNLCGSNAEASFAASDAEGAWNIAVSGDVQHAFTSTIDELAEKGAAKLVMGCTCAGNPVDGLASISANVAGVTIASILDAAQPAADVNTITFISSDGYKVALPLSYVKQRHSMIVYEINDEEISEIAGSANQLWLGATSARYFAQNVAQIVLTAEKEAPPIPGTPEAGDIYKNTPNVSVKAAR